MMKKRFDFAGVGLALVSVICYYLPGFLSAGRQARIQEEHDKELKEQIMKEVEARYSKKIS